jgi:hypothetical protein
MQSLLSHLKCHTYAAMIEAWGKLHDYLVAQSLKPLENEAS